MELMIDLDITDVALEESIVMKIWSLKTMAGR